MPEIRRHKRWDYIWTSLERNAGTFNRVSRSDGHYDCAHPSDTQAQFCFYLRDGDDAPKGSGFTISTEAADGIDTTDTVLAVAEAVKAEIDRYLYSSNKPRIAKVAEYLKAHEVGDRIGRAHARVLRLRRELTSAEGELESALDEREEATDERE